MSERVLFVDDEPQVLEGSTQDAGFTMTSVNAGHMLGSTCVLIEAREKGQTTRLLFFGRCGAKGVADYQGPGAAASC